MVVFQSYLSRLFQTDFKTTFQARLLLPTLTQGGTMEKQKEKEERIKEGKE